MEIKIINKQFAVCKVKGIENIRLDDEFYFFGKTDEEISLVCEETSVPVDCIECEKGWKAFRLQGIFDFSSVGILSKISAILAENNISIFAISTYNTDYILVKIEDFENAKSVLLNRNYKINL